MVPSEMVNALFSMCVPHRCLSLTDCFDRGPCLWSGEGVFGIREFSADFVELKPVNLQVFECHCLESPGIAIFGSLINVT